MDSRHHLNLTYYLVYSNKVEKYMLMKSFTLKMDDGYLLCCNRWQPDAEEEIKGVIQLHTSFLPHCFCRSFPAAAGIRCLHSYQSLRSFLQPGTWQGTEGKGPNSHSDLPRSGDGYRILQHRGRKAVDRSIQESLCGQPGAGGASGDRGRVRREDSLCVRASDEGIPRHDQDPALGPDPELL